MIGSGGGLIRTQWHDRSIASLTYVRSHKRNTIEILKECQGGKVG